MEFSNVHPTKLSVCYEKDGTPYIWYEGEFTDYLNKVYKVIIPHLSLEFEELNTNETIDYDFEIYHSTFIPNRYVERTVKCKPANINGEEVFFYLTNKEDPPSFQF